MGTWRLAGGICYERYGEHVYLRHIDARKDFLFNPLVYDLVLARGDGGVPEDVCVLAEESRRLAEKRKPAETRRERYETDRQGEKGV